MFKNPITFFTPQDEINDEIKKNIMEELTKYQKAITQPLEENAFKTIDQFLEKINDTINVHYSFYYSRDKQSKNYLKREKCSLGIKKILVVLNSAEYANFLYQFAVLKRQGTDVNQHLKGVWISFELMLDAYDKINMKIPEMIFQKIIAFANLYLETINALIQQHNNKSHVRIIADLLSDLMRQCQFLIKNNTIFDNNYIKTVIQGINSIYKNNFTLQFISRVELAFWINIINFYKNKHLDIPVENLFRSLYTRYEAYEKQMQNKTEKSDIISELVYKGLKSDLDRFKQLVGEFESHMIQNNFRKTNPHLK